VPKQSYRVVLAVIVSLLLAISLESPHLKHPAIDLLVFYGAIGPKRIAAAHRMGHVVTFAIAATIALLVSDSRTRKCQTVLSLLAIAILTETMQHWVYRNPLEWWDIRDDMLGVLIGFLCLTTYQRVRAMRSDWRG